MNADVAFFMLSVVNLQIGSLLLVDSVEPATFASWCCQSECQRAVLGSSISC